MKGIPDVRGVALKNSALRAERYFGELSDALGRLPELIEKGVKDSVMSKSLVNTGFSADEDYKTAYDILNAAYSDKGWRNLNYINEADDMKSLTLARLIFLADKAEKERKLRILAVDDVSVVLNAISAVLEKEYEVFCLSKAEQVYRFLWQTVPDLFLLDIEMPGINGHELIKIIRGFEEHKETPIIFLTGNATVGNFQAAMAQGVADFISKPVDPATLLKKVQAQITKKTTG